MNMNKLKISAFINAFDILFHRHFYEETSFYKQLYEETSSG